MRHRVVTKIKEMSRQEADAVAHMATIRDVIEHLRNQEATGVAGLADPAVNAARIKMIQEEIESKKEHIASLNAKQVALQKSLAVLDAERRTALDEQRSLKNARLTLGSKLKDASVEVQRDEAQLADLGRRKEALTNQMRVKIQTQSIVQQQLVAAEDGVLAHLASLNEVTSVSLGEMNTETETLVTLLTSLVRASEYAVHRAKMASLGIALPEVEGEGPRIQAPEVHDDRTDTMRQINTTSSSASGLAFMPLPYDRRPQPLRTDQKLTAQLAALFAPMKDNPLSNPFFAHRSAPHACVAFVRVEVQRGSTSGEGAFVLLGGSSSFSVGGGGAGTGSAASSVGASTPSRSYARSALATHAPETSVTGASTFVLSSCGVLNLSNALLLYDSDVPLSSSDEEQYTHADDETAHPVLSSLTRFCVDVAHDLLEAYFVDAGGQRVDTPVEVDPEEDDAAAAAAMGALAPEAATEANEPEDPTAAPRRQSMSPKAAQDASSSADSAAAAAAAGAGSVVHGFAPGPRSSLLLSFRPGFRNRFLFNVDTFESASTVPPNSTQGSSVLSAVQHVVGQAVPALSASAPREIMVPGASAAAGGQSVQQQQPVHAVRLTTDTPTARRILHTLDIYFKKRDAAEAAEKAKARAMLAVPSGGSRSRSASVAGTSATSTASAAAASAAASSSGLPLSRSSSNSSIASGPSSSSGGAVLYKKDTSVYLEGSSELLHETHLRTLIKACPARYSLQVWGLVYSMARDGVSRTRFLDTLASLPCALIVFRDMRRAVFGGFASVPFRAAAAQNYYGSGECFVFRVHQPPGTEAPQGPLDPATPPSGSVQLFRWRGADEFFMITGENYLAMGGGSGYAWQVDSSFRFGSSAPCSTFESPGLASARSFEINEMEVWSPILDAAEIEIDGANAQVPQFNAHQVPEQTMENFFSSRKKK